MEVFADQTRRRWRLGNKIQEKIQTEDGEGESEYDSNDDGGDFHDAQIITKSARRRKN